MEEFANLGRIFLVGQGLEDLAGPPFARGSIFRRQIEPRIAARSEWLNSFKKLNNLTRVL
jgi:hypothetical protein